LLSATSPKNKVGPKFKDFEFEFWKRKEFCKRRNIMKKILGRTQTTFWEGKEFVF